jgi:hypothetical protein
MINGHYKSSMWVLLVGASTMFIIIVFILCIKSIVLRDRSETIPTASMLPSLPQVSTTQSQPQGNIERSCTLDQRSDVTVEIDSESGIFLGRGDDGKQIVVLNP